MKRVTVTIHSEKQPDVIYLGYALANEVNDDSLNFFSTTKFQPDEVLEIGVIYGSESYRFKTVMTHLHEQISSGKIMNALPDEAHPYPGRTFFRCFTRVVEKVSMTETDTTAEETPMADVTPINGNAVPEAA